MKPLFKLVVLLGVGVGTSACLEAQTEVPPPAPVYQTLAAAQLDELLAPIALYPDPLVAEILPAATLPAQIVMADRYVSSGGDPAQLDQQAWDASVQALARYPNVLKWLDDNLNWTTQMGHAFLYQDGDVLDSLQRLRLSAYNLGNLQSTPQELVVNDDGDITIDPVDPDEIYVPVYPWDQVFSDAANGQTLVIFGGGWPIGPWLHGDFDWRHHHLLFWNHDHPRPPGWWRTAPRQRNPGFGPVWHPSISRDAPVVNHGDRGWEPSRVLVQGHPGGVVVEHHPDTGWSTPQNQPVVATISRSMSDSVRPRQSPAPAVRPATQAFRSEPEPTERSRSGDNVTFIGGQNSAETRVASERGRQSLQTTHAQPIAHSAPSAGGGGSKKR